MAPLRDCEELSLKSKTRNPKYREPPTPKMELEQTLALTPALSPRRGGSRAVPGIFTPFGVECFMGTHVGCYGS